MSVLRSVFLAAACIMIMPHPPGPLPPVQSRDSQVSAPYSLHTASSYNAIYFHFFSSFPIYFHFFLLRVIRTGRRVAQPNPGFQRQLGRRPFCSNTLTYIQSYEKILFSSYDCCFDHVLIVLIRQSL